MPTIYALKADPDAALTTAIRQSLNDGEGRFGWSYLSEQDGDADLHRIAEKIKRDGRTSLTKHEEDCNQSFLLNITPGDWVIYINMPSYGRCTMAKVTGKYFWRQDVGAADSRDFNHRFGVDPASVREFDRNDRNAVEPFLRARLGLQRRWWRIYAEREFEILRNALESGIVPRLSSRSANPAVLEREIEPLLREVTRKIQKTHPNYDLEHLLKIVFESMPGVRKVRLQGGAGDYGADLIIEYESGLPILVLQTQHTCIVQIKSYTGEHWDLKAVEDIRRAFEHYPIADIGLIISTADTSTPALDAAIDKLRQDTGKQVSLLIGADVARLFLRFSETVFAKASS